MEGGLSDPKQDQSSSQTDADISAAQSEDDEPFKERSCWQTFSALRSEFGIGIFYIIFTCFLSHGFSDTVTGMAANYIFKSRHVSTEAMTHYGMFFSLCATSKLAYAIASNVLPVGGLTMRPYAALGGGMIMVANAAIAVFREALPTDLYVLARVCNGGAVHFLNVIGDTLMAIARNRKPSLGPALYSFLSYGNMAKRLLAACVSWKLLEFDVYAAHIVATVTSLSVFPAVVNNFFPEERKSAEEVRAQRAHFIEDKGILYFMLSLLGIALYLLIVGACLGSMPYTLWFVTMVGMGALCLCWRTFANTDFTALIVYFVVGSSCQVNVGAAAFYFFTDDEKAYPEGPHFSPMFMVTVLPLLSIAGNFVGITIYNAFMSNWNFRSVVCIPLCTKMALHIVDAIQFSRLNRRVGLPDWAFVFGTHAFADSLEAWSILVERMVVARLCPSGMEATVVALFHFSQLLSHSGNSAGSAALLHSLGVAPDGTPGDAGRLGSLWVLSLISGLGVLVQLALVRVAIPDAPQEEPVHYVRGLHEGSLYGGPARAGSEGSELELSAFGADRG